MRKIPSFDNLEIDLSDNETVELQIEDLNENTDSSITYESDRESSKEEDLCKEDNEDETDIKRIYKRLCFGLIGFLVVALFCLSYYAVRTYLPKIIELIQTGAIS